MNHHTLDLLLAAGCVAVALVIGAVCGVGLLVWLAGGRTSGEAAARLRSKDALRLP